MKYIGKLLGIILLCVNVVVALLLLVSAYSAYIHPQIHPIASCAGLFFPVFLVLNLLFLVFWLLVCRRYALLPVLVLVACWGGICRYCPMNWWGEEAPENAVKILSYNTRAFGLKASHTKEKSNEVIAYLQECDADIICLQEYIWGKRLKKKDIDYALRKYPYRHYLPLGGGLNGLGCYSRYPILSATPIKCESRRNGSVIYQIKVDKDTLWVANNHLESTKILESDVEIYQDMIDAPDSKKLSAGLGRLLSKLGKANAIRSQQAFSFSEKLKSFQGKPLVLCGDFNDTSFSYTYRLLAKDMKDAFVEAGNGLGITYEQNRLYFRIDHILLSKDLKVYECVVDDAAKGSDHYPIWCTLSF